MSYVHPTIAERTKIETYFELGFSIRKIAKILDRNPSTIINRNSNYSSENTQEKYQSNKSNCGAKTKLTSKLKDKFQEKLSFKSIYRWIYQGLLSLPLTVLWQKGTRQKPRKIRGNLILELLYLRDLKKLEKEVLLVIGNLIRLFLVIDKPKNA